MKDIMENKKRMENKMKTPFYFYVFLCYIDFRAFQKIYVLFERVSCENSKSISYRS